MVNYDSIIDKYQGNGLPYRDRSDDIRVIALNLCRSIYSRDRRIIRELLLNYKYFSFIKDIRIEHRKCIIEYDEGVVSFDVFSPDFFDNFSHDVFGFCDISGQCHNVSQKILEACHNENISAVTSLCINTNYILYFHSYILDRGSNKVIDFTRKFVMDKNQFDKLFCYKQINDLNYYEYRDRLINSDYSVDSKLFPLLYLSLDKLENEKDEKVRSKVLIK